MHLGDAHSSESTASHETREVNNKELRGEILETGRGILLCCGSCSTSVALFAIINSSSWAVKPVRGDLDGL